MTVNAIENHDLNLIKSLIELKGLSISKASALMNIQRTNLSSWLNGKPNVFSIKKIEGMLDALGMCAMGDASTGGVLRYLSTNMVHLWHVEKNSQSLLNVLRSTESDSSLKWMEIFEVNAHPKGRFNLMRRKSDSGDLIILISNSDSSSLSFPITPEILGFGKNAGSIELSLEKWIGWWKMKSLSTSLFREELGSILSNKVNENVDKGLTSHELEITISKLKESKCTTEGLKAIIREFQHEMDKINPDNRLQKHNVRDIIFEEYYNKEANSLGIQGLALSAKKQ